MNNMISVVVPVYNVERYLEECLCSILAQTYKNIEVILVDDGSTDKSGLICDSYAQKDMRIHVIHKFNGGVSSARNTGISHAGGNYIGFVDPDDYIDNTMFETLFNTIKDNNADISVCNYSIIGKDEKKTRRMKKSLLDKNEALELLIKDEELSSYLWNKLFRVELFKDCNFDNKYRYEDLRIMHKLFLEANIVVTIPNILYFYRLREGSITNTTMLNNSKELIDALEARCKDLKENKIYYNACITEMLQIRRILIEILLNKAEKGEFYQNNLCKVKKLYSECVFKLNLNQKIKFTLFFCSPKLYAKYLYYWRKGQG